MKHGMHLISVAIISLARVSGVVSTFFSSSFAQDARKNDISLSQVG